MALPAVERQQRVTPDRYERIGELFDGALELPAGPARDAYLANACAGDDALRDEVLSLLANHERATDFLAPSEAAAFAQANPEAFTIGPYKIERQLGEGGMGTVYLAVQTEPIKRNVALKVIKPGMGSRAIIARFESERRALAMMDHPHIAQVFDVGATSQGLPYFAMEFVDGLPVTRYCEKHGLSIRQRIELFIPICQAIHHAHQKGIIHRDIKPSNVLVKEIEGQAIPKVIDFGLAKALDPEWSGETMMTNAGMILGTLQYMSPEQAAPGVRDIDIRSDVYSLGALLYELLTGTTPLDAGQLARETYQSLLERVREQEPPPPSVRRRETAAGPDNLDRELDWIPLKALEKERERRYESVNGMVRDLERYLVGEPVEAAPPSRAYRVRKFVRRNRIGFTVASAFLLVLVAAVIVSVSMAIRARRAERESSAVNAFLRTDVLAQADPHNQAKPKVAPDPNLTVRVALDRAALNIEGKFPNDPLVESAVRETIGNAYQGLGIYPKAQQQAEKALQLRSAALGENHRLTLKSRQMLATLVSVQGKYRESEPILAELLAARRQSLGAEDPDTLETMAALAQSYRLQAKYEPAVELFAQAIPALKRVLGPEDPATLSAMNILAATYFEHRNLAQAEALQKQVVELRRKTLGEEHPDTLQAMTALAATYDFERRYAEEEALYLRSLAIQRRVNGVPHPDTLVTMYNLATLYSNQKRFPEAVAIFEENRAARGKVYPPDHPRTLRLLVNLASAYGGMGRADDEARLLEEALAGQVRVLGADHPDALKTKMYLADAYADTKPARAEALAREAVKGMKARFGPGHTATMEAVSSLAPILLAARKYPEAEQILRESLQAATPAEDEEMLPRLEATSLLGAALTAQGRLDAAEPLLIKAYEGIVTQKIAFGEMDKLKYAGARLADLYQAKGQPSKAADWKQRTQADLQRMSAAPQTAK